MKKTLCLVIACFFLFFARFLPVSTVLSADAVQMLGIFVGAIILWLGVAIDWPSVLVLAALCILPQAGTSAVMAASLGNTTISFLIFSFILTYSLSQTGFLKRCALWFINNSFARRGTWHFIFMYMAAVFFIGCFIAPTVTFLIFFSLSKEIFASLNLEKGDASAKAIMVGSAVMTSISCAATPIAHTFPLMAIGYYEAQSGQSISYFQYLKISLPCAVILFFLLMLVLKLFYGKSAAKTDKSFSHLTFERYGRITKSETIALTVFLIVVAVWMITGIFPAKTAFLSKLGTSVPAMFGVVILCFIKVNGKSVLDFKDAITNGVSWSSIMLCGATLAVGKFLTLPELGITSSFTKLVGPLCGAMSESVLLLCIIALSVILTNLMSNIVTTTLMYNITAPIVTALALGGGNVSLATASILIGMCASLAYATPPAIAHIAIAAGSEWASPSDMLKVGGVMSAASIITVWLIALL